jgi:hypothetical protein
MKNTILTIFITLLSLISNSQVITVSTKGLQVYFRPKNMTLSECQEKNLVEHKYFGNGDCLYIFDLNKKVFTLKPQYTNWESSFKIIEIRKNDNVIDLTTEDGTTYLITDNTEYNEEIFLIEYFDLPNEVEGRFAKKEDYSVSIKYK